MERKVFLKQEKDRVVIMIKHLTSGDLEPLATYDIKTKDMVLHNVPRYFYVLRHIESLHLILGYLEGKGLIDPVGDTEPLSLKKITQTAKPQTVNTSREVDWLVSVETLEAILDRDSLTKKYFAEFKEQLPRVGDKYLIAKTNVKDRTNLENMSVTSLMSPSLKQSLIAVLGAEAVNRGVESWLSVTFDLGVNDDFVLFNLQNTTNFVEFKKEVSALRKRS